jgi:hypothetical protein
MLALQKISPKRSSVSFILGRIMTLDVSSPLGGMTLLRLLAPSIMMVSLLSTPKRGAIAAVVSDAIAAVIGEIGRVGIVSFCCLDR